ncbi:YheC/YheD family protein [Clostridium thermarum]|uniref:YheC/YheD family endospore coat-associated protein n=1 Tax=Clostridium thermarum TaxID=1716543 RepID=UPI001124939D|nr:YheC/YheD family protein [Clostridium thermarum]
MWIRIEVVTSNREIIVLPQELTKRIESEVKVEFGRSSTVAAVRPSEELQYTGGDDYDNPLQIILSSKLVDKLNIQANLTYQMKLSSRRITIGPVIGLLLGAHDYIYSPEHMTKYSDRFGIYKEVGGLIYAFSERAIDWKNSTIYGLYYNISEKKWEYGKFPIPSVIYRRDFHSNKDTIKRLMEYTNGKMFNSWRFGKFYLYKHIKRNRKLAMHVPRTEVTEDFRQVKRFIDDIKDVILKPIYLSRGRGICIIQKRDDRYKVADYRNNEVKEFILENDSELKRFFDENTEFFDKYLIQQHLSLAKIEGAPYDIRVVMQKLRQDQWKCSGIECRVAAKKSMITNISRGGYALTLDEALACSFKVDEEERQRIKDKVYELCFRLCESLDRLDHHFAEFGIDIALDADGNAWIIEVNVFPSFKGFKLMDYETYLGIRYTPILYAAHLAGF